MVSLETESLDTVDKIVPEPLGHAAVHQALCMISIQVTDDKADVCKQETGSTTDLSRKSARAGLDQLKHISTLDVDDGVLVAGVRRKYTFGDLGWFDTHSDSFVGSKPDNAILLEAGLCVRTEAANRQSVCLDMVICWWSAATSVTANPRKDEEMREGETARLDIQLRSFLVIVHRVDHFGMSP